MMAATLEGPQVEALFGQVLVVDDDLDLQGTVCEILSMTGVQANGVASASEAAAWCELHTPDLVLLDQRLPDASGLQLAATLKANNPLLPIVLLTGFVSADTAIAAVGLVDDYLTKPVPPGELIKVVRSRMEQHRLRLANQDLLERLTEANTRLEATVLERTAELRAARDKAMEASRLKSQFLANMSHEIRTPMTGVLGAADLLVRATNLTEQQRRYVDILSTSGKALLSLINDILDFSKIEAGHLELESASFELRDIFIDVVRMLEPQATGKGLQLRLDLDPDLPGAVVGDALRLRQVVTNLVGNAVKFTDTGQVEVTVRPTTRGPGVTTVRCEVSDSGIGISAEDIPSLFVDFSQVDPSHTRRFGGTGLGLAISDRLVRGMNGEIGCLPREGGGSTFWFAVPFPTKETAFTEADARVEEPRSHHDLLESSPTILVVDDNEINGSLMASMIGLLGYRSETVTSGADAMNAVENGSYAAVLMDCQMPVMDGFATTAALRAGDHDALPIIAVTATATAEDRARCLAAGMDDYLAKPIVMDRLAATLSRWAPLPAT
jgi:signal transduction histidine kinase